MCVCVCILSNIYTSPSVVRAEPNLAHTHADSPRKGSGQNKNLPRVTRGAHGVFRDQKLKKMGEIC